MLTRIRHVGIMVKDMQSGLDLYQRLFNLKPSNEEELPEYGLRNALLPMKETFLELLQPTTDASAGAAFLRRSGEGLYILVFETPDRDAALASLESKGAALAGIYEGGKFTNLWVHPRSTHGVFIELIQRSKENPWPPGGEGWQSFPRAPIFKELKSVVVMVADFKKAAEDYHRLFQVQPSPPVDLAHGLRGVSIPIGAGETVLELVSPIDSTSAGARFLERRGQGLYLLALDVFDLDSAVRHIQDGGGVITSTDQGADGATAWVHPKSTSGVLIQLSQAR